MDHNVLKNTLRFGIVGASVVIVVAACSGSRSASGGGTKQTYSTALESNLLTCAESAHTCYENANNDPAQLQVCRDDLASCTEQAQAAAEAQHEALRACFTTAYDCFSGQDDAGTSAAQCVTNLRACIDANRPPPPPLPPCAEAYRECVSGGDGGMSVSDSGRQTTWGWGDFDRQRECGTQFFACVQESLPPCVSAFHDCIQSGEMLSVCAEAARQCIMQGPTADGGGASPPDGGASSP